MPLTADAHARGRSPNIAAAMAIGKNKRLTKRVAASEAARQRSEDPAHATGRSPENA